MLTKRRPDLNEMVWEAAAQVGQNAPKIADAILERAFPRTHAEATIEGADKLLRDGLIATVKSVLRTAGADVEQLDFSDIDEAFREIAGTLKRPSYYVEKLAEYVAVGTLIARPDLLDDARRFLRRKGEECIAEADRLDQLHAAVLAAKPSSPSSQEAA